jgi:hypothetical protein
MIIKKEFIPSSNDYIHLVDSEYVFKSKKNIGVEGYDTILKTSNYDLTNLFHGHVILSNAFFFFLIFFAV